MDEIKKGDMVECKRPKGVSPSYDLKAGRMYKIYRIASSGAIYLIGEPRGYTAERFRKVVPIAPAIVPDPPKFVTKDEINDVVCEFCRDHYEMSPSYLCEGVKCEEAMDLYLDDNNLKLKEEDDMAELNVNKNVMAVFGSNVTGNELEVINRHYTNDMLQQIVMRKHSKEVQEECIAAQEKLDADKTS